jgi:hypothetical protein
MQSEVHVLLGLEGKFFVVELDYLAGFLLPVEEVLHTHLRGLQLVHLALKLCKYNKRSGSDYLSTSNNYPTSPTAYICS